MTGVWYQKQNYKNFNQTYSFFVWIGHILKLPLDFFKSWAPSIANQLQKFLVRFFLHFSV